MYVRYVHTGTHTRRTSQIKEPKSYLASFRGYAESQVRVSRRKDVSPHFGRFAVRKSVIIAELRSMKILTPIRHAEFLWKTRYIRTSSIYVCTGYWVGEGIFFLLFTIYSYALFKGEMDGKYSPPGTFYFIFLMKLNLSILLLFEINTIKI